MRQSVDVEGDAAFLSWAVINLMVLLKCLY